MGLRRAVLSSNPPPLSIHPSSILIPASEVSKVNLMSERRAFVLDMEGRVLTSHSFSSDLCTWGTNTRCQDVFPG